MTTTTLSTLHTNEVIVVDAALDPQGRATVTLGLVNQDRGDPLPGRTLSPDQCGGRLCSAAPPGQRQLKRGTSGRSLRCRAAEADGSLIQVAAAERVS